MPARRSVIVGSRADEMREVIVRELTVAEVRDWLAEYEYGELGADVVHAMVWEDFGLDDLARMSNATAAELEAYTPTQLAPLVIVCKEINPHFFRPRAAVAAVARALEAEAGRMISTKAASPS
jgi:hypothetical protein